LYIPELKDDEVSDGKKSVGKSVSGTDGKLGKVLSPSSFLIPFKDSALSKA
jgi:hypothetical protein